MTGWLKKKVIDYRNMLVPNGSELHHETPLDRGSDYLVRAMKLDAGL